MLYIVHYHRGSMEIVVSFFRCLVESTVGCTSSVSRVLSGGVSLEDEPMFHPMGAVCLDGVPRWIEWRI